MAKKIIEQKEKSQSYLSKLKAYFKKSGETAGEDEEKKDGAESDDDEEKDAEDETPEVDDDAADDTSAEDESGDDTEANNGDGEEGEEEEEETEMKVNGKVVNLNDRKATRAAIQGLLNKTAEQDKLLKGAMETIEANQVQLNKTAEEVKKEIKSSFTPQNSRRSDKSKPEAGVPAFLAPPKDSIAARAVQDTLNKAKK